MFVSQEPTSRPQELGTAGGRVPFCRRADQLCTISRRRTHHGHLMLKTKRRPKSSSTGACFPLSPLEKNHRCSTIFAFAPELTKSAPYQCLRCRRTKPTNQVPDPSEAQGKAAFYDDANAAFEWSHDEWMDAGTKVQRKEGANLRPPGGGGAGSRAVQPFFLLPARDKGTSESAVGNLRALEPESARRIRETYKYSLGARQTDRQTDRHAFACIILHHLLSGSCATPKPIPRTGRWHPY